MATDSLPIQCKLEILDKNSMQSIHWLSYRHQISTPIRSMVTHLPTTSNMALEISTDRQTPQPISNYAESLSSYPHLLAAYPDNFLSYDPDESDISGTTSNSN